LNGRVIAAELWTDKGIEGICLGLFEAPYWNFVEALRETTIVGVLTDSPTQHLSNAKQNHLRPFIVQGAYKLSEDFAKPYFYKY